MKLSNVRLKEFRILTYQDPVVKRIILQLQRQIHISFQETTYRSP